LTLKPRVDKIGWVIIIVALSAILLSLGLGLFIFPKSSNWSTLLLVVGGLLAIVLAVHQANRRKQMQKQNFS